MRLYHSFLGWEGSPTKIDREQLAPLFERLSTGEPSFLEVRLWDVERKLCLQSFHDAGAAVTCAKFGFGGSGDQVLVASSWDSSLNLWDASRRSKMEQDSPFFPGENNLGNSWFCEKNDG